MLFITETPEYPVVIVADLKIEWGGRVRTVFVTMKDGTTKTCDIRCTVLLEAAAGENDSK